MKKCLNFQATPCNHFFQVRHPVDRMASWFYYRRWQDRPDDENPKNVCAKNPQWETFCAKMEAIRGQDLQQTTQW